MSIAGQENNLCSILPSKSSDEKGAISISQWRSGSFFKDKTGEKLNTLVEAARGKHCKSE